MGRRAHAHPASRRRHKKRKSFVRWLGVVMYSTASLTAAHATTKTVDSSKTKKTSRLSIGNDYWPTLTALLKEAPVPGSLPQYPWHTDIVTTTFWIGEKPTENNPVPNHKSCWDAKWAQSYGGTDSPKSADRRSEFIPRGFTPRQNPFYVALPYNDMTSKGHKSEAAQVVPWYQADFRSPARSVCKGRWIAIRRGDKICYAQWEDAGPFRTDHAAYVFGNERPQPNLNKGAGLDVSPAVRDFLGMEDTDVTDWKFVEFADIPEGPWSVFGDNNTFVTNRREAAEKVLLALAKRLNEQPTVVD